MCPAARSKSEVLSYASWDWGKKRNVAEGASRAEKRHNSLGTPLGQARRGRHGGGIEGSRAPGRGAAARRGGGFKSWGLGGRRRVGRDETFGGRMGRRWSCLGFLIPPQLHTQRKKGKLEGGGEEGSHSHFLPATPRKGWGRGGQREGAG